MRVGVDLGTSYSLIARVAADGRPELLPDHSEQDVFNTPSVVHLSGSCAMVGRLAETLLEQNPDLRVIRFFKQQLGQAEPVFSDEQGTAWYPEGITALLLKKLRFDAESYASRDIEAAAIAVPGHFNDVQRKAALAAGLLADIPAVGLVEEPVAAAIHYGIAAAAHDQVLLVYNFGGGFDATVLSMNLQRTTVLAKTWLTDVGGKELDEVVGEILLQQFERALGKKLPLSARARLELRRVSEGIKIGLCLPGRSIIRQTVLLDGKAIEATIRCADFEARIGDLISRTEAETLRCLKEAGLTSRDVDALLLIGSSSMVPPVMDRIRALLGAGRKVCYHEPGNAVALGAALYVSRLASEAARSHVPAEFRGLSGYCVGVRVISPETGGVTTDTLIRKNMPLPVKAKKVYYTTRANQERMVLELVQYCGADDPAVSIGQLVVGPLPSPRRNYPIDVTVENREDGTVAVQAYDSQTGVELAQVFGGDHTGPANAATQRARIRSTFINNF